MSSKLAGLLVLTRPFNLLLGAATIAIGAWISGATEATLGLAAACFSGALIMAGGNSINDYFDADIDSVNKPARPIPAGRVAPAAALFLATILLVLGVFLSIFINRFCFAIALFVALGLVLYGWRSRCGQLPGPRCP